METLPGGVCHCSNSCRGAEVTGPSSVRRVAARSLALRSLDVQSAGEGAACGAPCSPPCSPVPRGAPSACPLPSLSRGSPERVPLAHPRSSPTRFCPPGLLNTAGSSPGPEPPAPSSSGRRCPSPPTPTTGSRRSAARGVLSKTEDQSNSLASNCLVSPAAPGPKVTVVDQVGKMLLLWPVPRPCAEAPPLR